MDVTVTVRGRFDGEHIELLEKPPVAGPCEVTVRFEPSEEQRQACFERARGAWQDSRTTDEIIEDMMGSRRLAPWPGDTPPETGDAPKLSDDERRRLIHKTRGAWKDSRTTEEIIEDIVGSRSYGREAPEL